MEKITLHSNESVDTTTVSNVFIDSYMPAANGSYVKVYLYLLRCLSGHIKDFSISCLADRLDDTEKDIIRALKYWEKVKLIQLSNNESGSITSITLNEPSSMEESDDLKNTEPALAASMKSAETAFHPPTVPERPVYTTSQVAELSNNDEVKWIMNIIELYFERPLKPKDIQLILYLYDSVDFSPELIMYLYEYCISKNKRNAAYIEAVALSWAEQGISTVEQAESISTLYNSNYTSINKAFGINRAPGSIEKEYMDKWLTKYSFSIEIIVEACNRTILNTQKADFKYADKILENWFHGGVKKMEDIKKLDVKFNASKNTNITPLPKEIPLKPVNNRFNAFPQRSYSKEDYADMEKRLLTSQS